jgi:uncharacterized protein
MSPPAQKRRAPGTHQKKTVNTPVRSKSRAGTRKSTRVTKKKTKTRSFGYLITGFICIIVLLAATVVILDQRAMKRGHIGLWETLVGITPAVTDDDVFVSVENILNHIGYTGITLRHEGRTVINNSKHQNVIHMVYTVSDEHIFENLEGEFESKARREGVNVYRRHSIRNPEEWLQTYYIGTHAKVTHKIDLYFYPKDPSLPSADTGKETPAVLHDDEHAPDLPGPSIALIFDDFGPNKAIAHRFLNELNVPITIAVLPWQPFSDEIISMTNQADQTVFLHVPMEPYNPDAMGNMADQYLLTWMDDEELLRKTVEMLNDYPDVTGVNNHTGSKMTEDRPAMRVFLSEIRERNLIFIDSRTTAGSVAEEEARSLGIPTASRHVFIDQGYDGGDVKANMRQLADIAKRNGHAIGIGHAIDSTLDQVKDVLPEILQDGVQVVPIESLVN